MTLGRRGGTHVANETLDQLMAFTLTDDHATQERVWFDGG